MRYPQLKPDLLLILKIVPGEDLSEKYDSEKDFIVSQIEWILFEPRASSYPDALKTEIKEDLDVYKVSKKYDSKAYTSFHLLIQVLSDIYNAEAATKKKYFTRKDDPVTWQSFYEKIYKNSEDKTSVIGLRILLYLVPA